MSAAPREALLPAVIDIAEQAGAEIMAVYRSGPVAHASKQDASPLTEADLRAHRLIERALRLLTPQIPVLSEEGADTPFAERSRWRRHWLVDPLDGTREFLAKNGEFTVNIALIEAHAPVLGVVGVPALNRLYAGIPGRGAWRRDAPSGPVPIRVRSQAQDPIRVVGSRSHRGDSLDAFLKRLPSHQLVPVGSALKFCLVAEGAADVYPRLGPTSEWDTAAAHAVLLAAGGEVRTLDGQPLAYNAKADLLNPSFIAYGDSTRDWLKLLG